MKISAKFETHIVRYANKNSLSGRLKSHQMLANIGMIGSVAEAFRFPNWQIEDLGIASFFGTFALHNIKEMLELIKKLKPIRQRAASIKKATRMSNHN